MLLPLLRNANDASRCSPSPHTVLPAPTCPSPAEAEEVEEDFEEDDIPEEDDYYQARAAWRCSKALQPGGPTAQPTAISRGTSSLPPLLVA